MDTCGGDMDHSHHNDYKEVNNDHSFDRSSRSHKDHTVIHIDVYVTGYHHCVCGQEVCNTPDHISYKKEDIFQAGSHLFRDVK